MLHQEEDEKFRGGVKKKRRSCGVRSESREAREREIEFNMAALSLRQSNKMLNVSNMPGL